MGCANSSTKAVAAPTNSSTKAAAAPTLLTSKPHSIVVEKGVKDILLVTSRDNLGAAPPPEESAERIEEVPKHQSYTLAPKEAEEKSMTHLPSDPEPLLAPSPPVDTIKSPHSNVHASPPQSTRESFASIHSGRSAASAYSTATNFTFGQKCSPMPMPSQLLTLQEDETLAETEGEEVLEDIPEYFMPASYVVGETSDELPEDSVATIGRAVEQSVHALVDAGEGLWSHVKNAWTTRYSMLTPAEEEEDADSDAKGSEVEASRQGRWRHLKGLDWSCGTD